MNTSPPGPPCTLVASPFLRYWRRLGLGALVLGVMGLALWARVAAVAAPLVPTADAVVPAAPQLAQTGLGAHAGGRHQSAQHTQAQAQRD